MATAKNEDIRVVTPEEPVSIFIPADSDAKEEEQFVLVVVNGVNYQVQRGVQVEVPYSVFETLYNSGKYPKL